jgi:putative ABC transport system ATP-binding protein
MSLFELTRVEVWRGQRRILHLPSLSLDKQGFTVVAGPNGAGKTTLFRLLAGQLTDYRGNVSFLGRALSELNPVQYARQVQYVFQHPVFLSGTVRYNLERPLAWHGWLDRERQALLHQLALDFGLADKLNQLAGSLSGGEAQRLSLLRSLLFQPEVLLVDEPTANVDAEQAGLIGRYLALAASQGDATVLVATHDPELMKLADRVLYLVRGEVDHWEIRSRG